MSGFFADVVHSILWIAGLLKYEPAAGVVVIAFLIAFVLAVICYLRVYWRRQRALTEFCKALGQNAPDAAVISVAGFEENDTPKGKDAQALQTAWAEYRNTAFAHKGVYRSTARPQMFFNREDLHFDAGVFKIMPGLFVSFGLFCTFLGLISALSSMGLSLSASAHNSDAALKELLTVASAKFIMSLTGLLLSILFTIVLKFFGGKIGALLGGLNRQIEKRFSYISLEFLAVQQLEAEAESRDQMKSIITEAVADLGRPLREELPQAIRESVNEAITPVMEKISQNGNESVSGMVEGLSKTLSGEIGSALSQASGRLADAGDQFRMLVERMNESSGNMGAAMGDAVARLSAAAENLQNNMQNSAQSAGDMLNQGAEKILASMEESLKAIRDNTGEGAQAIAAAAESMGKAGQAVSEALEQAAGYGAAAVEARANAAADSIGRQTAEFSQQAGAQLFSPLQDIAQKIAETAELVAENSKALSRASDAVKSGADAAERASGSFGSSARALTDSVAPVRGVAEEMGRSVQLLRDSTDNQLKMIASAAQANAEQSRTALESAARMLDGERQSVEATLSQLQTIIGNLKGQGEDMARLNELLGWAFEQYRQETEKAVSSLRGHFEDMRARLAPAVATLQDVVSAAEKFRARQPRG